MIKLNLRGWLKRERVQPHDLSSTDVSNNLLAPFKKGPDLGIFTVCMALKVAQKLVLL